MINEQIYSATFPKLKNCAQFLLQNHLEDLVYEQIKESKALNLPIINTFQSDKEIFDFFSFSYQQFLNDIINNKGLEGYIRFINKFKEDQLPWFSNKNVTLTDISAGLSIRKKVLYKFIPHYTTDIQEALEIVNEIESFYQYVDKYLFQVFIDLRQYKIDNEKKLSQAIIHNSINGVLVYGHGLTILVWNNALELAALECESVVGKKIGDVFPWANNPLMLNKFEKVLSGEKHQLLEYKIPGIYGYFDINLVPIKQESGHFIGLCTIHDVTEKLLITENLREHKEELQVAYEELQDQINEISSIKEALKKSEAQYRILAENTSDLITTHNSKGEITHASGSSRNVLGYEPEELIGRSIFKFIHNDDIPNISESLRKIWNHDKLESVTFRFKNKNGDYCWIESTGKALKKTGTDQITELQVCSRDITTRKNAERELAKERQFFWAVLENINDAIVACDEFGNISFFNKAAREYHGLPESPIKANKWASYYNLYYPDGRERLKTEDIPLFRACNGESIKDFEMVVAPKNGKKRTFLATATQIYNADNTPGGAVAAMHDITDKKEWEEKLLKSEALLQESQDIAHLGSWEWNLESNLLIWSEQLKKIFQFDPNKEGMKIKNRPYLDFVHPEDQPVLKEKFEQLKLSGTPFTLEHKILLKDGSIKWMLSKGKPLYKKNVKLFTGIVLDITDLKLAELKVKEDNLFIQSIANAIPDVIFLYDIESGENIYTSREISTLLGNYTNAPVLWNGEALKHIVHPDDLSIASTYFKKILNAPGSNIIETDIRLKDASGLYKTFLLRSSVFKRNEAGEASQIIGLIQDITDKVKAENAAKYSEAQLLEAQRLANVGSFEWDIIRDTITWSPEMYRIFGWEPGISSVNLEAFESTVHPEDKATVKKAINDCLLNFKDFDLEHKILLPDQSVKIVSSKGKLFLNKTGEPAKLIGSTMDITERRTFEDELQKKNHAILNAYKKLEIAQKDLHRVNSKLEEMVKERTRQLLRTNKELKEKNKQLLVINSDLDNFIYTASHDLKSPISNLEGLTSLLHSELEGRLNKKEKEIMVMIETSINKFKQTIKDLSEITKVQKEINEKLEVVSFSKILDDIKSDLHPMILESKAKIISDFKIKEVPYAVKNLRSIVYNLLTNAIKYRSPDRGLLIEVGTEKEGDFIKFSIKDNGLGFNPEQKSKLFNMFKRFHTHVEGTGIGLYIVKRIIENHGGRIEVESEVGKGSLFKVFFNIKDVIMIDKPDEI